MSQYPPTTIYGQDMPTYINVNISTSLRVVVLPAASTVAGKLLYFTTGASGTFSTFTIPSSLYISTTGIDSFEGRSGPLGVFGIISTPNTTLQVASDGQSNWMIVGLSQSSTSGTTLNPFIRSSFSPDQIANLRIWFDASDQGTIVPSTNNQVARWWSKAPRTTQRFTANVTTGALITSGGSRFSAPALTGVHTLGGRNVLFFSTTSEMFFSSAILSQRSVFTVINPRIGPDSNFPSTLVWGNSTGNNYNLLLQYDSNSSRPFGVETARASIATPYTSIGFSNSPFLSPLLLSAVNGATSQNVLALNGNAFPLDTNVAHSFTATSINYLINRHFFSTSFDLAELIVYNDVISVSNRQIVEGYLAWKWQLYENLPPSHPYRFNSPTFNFNF